MNKRRRYKAKARRRMGRPMVFVWPVRLAANLAVVSALFPSNGVFYENPLGAMGSFLPDGEQFSLVIDWAAV